MNGAQRAAFIRMLKVADEMDNVLYVISTSSAERLPTYLGTIRDLQQRWDAARNRYFELEAEARKAKSSARKSRGAIARKRGVNQPKNSNV